MAGVIFTFACGSTSSIVGKLQVAIVWVEIIISGSLMCGDTVEPWLIVGTLRKMIFKGCGNMQDLRLGSNNGEMTWLLSHD